MGADAGFARASQWIDADAGFALTLFDRGIRDRRLALGSVRHVAVQRRA